MSEHLELAAMKIQNVYAIGVRSWAECHELVRDILRESEPVSREAERRGTERDRIAFEAGWIAHETASGTEGIGGAEIQMAADYREWLRTPEPVTPLSEQETS